MTTTAPDVALRSLSQEQATALVEGRRLPGWHDAYPTEGDVVIARFWVEAPWQPAPQQVVHDGLVVGGIGAKGPVTDGEVEIGYGLVDGDQGHGVGTAALSILLDDLAAIGVRRVLADTGADNGASQRMLLRAGFTVLGENAQEVLFNKHL